jgi:hypothetical protein
VCFSTQKKAAGGRQLARERDHGPAEDPGIQALARAEISRSRTVSAKKIPYTSKTSQGGGEN